MPDYEKMYHLLFNAITDALEQIKSQNYGNEGLSYTVAGLEKNNLAFFYNRIGSYDFTKKNIPNRIKPLDREYTKSFCFHKINTQNIQESFIVDFGVISNKINELIAAVNELRENHE